MKTLTLLITIILAALTVTAQITHVPDDIKNTKVFKRFAWEYNQRAYPFDTIPHIKYAREMAKEIQKIKNSSMKSSRTPLWSSIGPYGVNPMSFNEHWGVMSGRVRAVAVHPDDPLTVYIGAASGGIWKTMDGGENWSDLGADLESLNFGAIAIDPSNPNVVYAGSGESVFFAGTINFYGRGVFKSTDGGDTWVQINDLGEFTFFSDLVVSPYNSDIVLGALASASVYLGSTMPNEGIWKSTDAGNTWIRTLDVQDAYDILFHPTDPDIVYATVGGMNSSSGFYISTDQGDTWTQVNSGLQAANTIARIQFDLSLSNSNILYAVIYQHNGGNPFLGTTRAYKSVDGGNNWVQISNGIPLGGNYGSGWFDQGFYDLCIAVDPANPDHVFIGNIELHETMDGSNFSPYRPNGNNAYGSLVHTDYHKLVYAPSDPDYLYIGCDGGIYKSTDGGTTATSQNTGLETLQLYRIGSHPDSSQIVIGGMQDNSTAMTFDGGSSWNQVTGGDGMECFFDYANPEIIYTSSQNGRLMKSVNGGNSFLLIKVVNGAWITPFFMHPDSNEILYTANKSVLKSVNGQTFTIIAENVAPVSISTMAQSAVNPDNMIFATGYGNTPIPDNTFLVKVSTDGGYNWNDVTANIPGETRWISRVVADPFEENTMYILRTGFSPGNKVYKTTDLGDTWANISGDLPDLPCNDLFIDPDSTGHFYLANDLGVYMSSDGGETWTFASEGMPYVPVFDFDYVNINGERLLRAGTHGRSIYEANIDIHVGINENRSLKHGEVQVYPNPFTTSTTIEFSLQQNTAVEITLYNQVGQRVVLLEKGNYQKGNHRLVFNGSRLPIGIYYCVLKTENKIKTTKMIKLK